MSFNTRNPLPSTAAKDLYDNAENLDRAINGGAASWVDRLGTARTSWAGFQSLMSAFLSSNQGTFERFIADNGLKTFESWAQMQADTSQPVGMTGQVIGEGGSHTDPVTGGSVPNAGQYRWTGAAWRFLRADLLPLKLDRAAFNAVIAEQAVEDLLVAICDQNQIGTWLQARSLDGGPSDFALRLLRKRVPSMPDDSADVDPEVLVRITDDSSPPRRTWLEVNTVDGGPTPFALALMQRYLNVDPSIEIAYVGEGDSMMSSAYGGGSNIPTILTGLLGKSFDNFAWSGSHASEMAVRAGGIVPLLVFPGGTLPADTGPVSVGWNVAGSYSSAQQPSRVYLGTVRGISCRLVYDTASGTLSINRTSAGSAIPLRSPVPFVPDPTYEGHHVHVLFGGRNNTPKSTAVAPLLSIIERYCRVGDRFLVCGVTTRNDEPEGSAGYAAIAEVNAALQAAAPRDYVDLQGRLMYEGLALVGLTPTAADIAAVAQGRIPPALIYSDSLHFNQSGRDAAARIIFNELQIRGLA